MKKEKTPKKIKPIDPQVQSTEDLEQAPDQRPKDPPGTKK
jgi:hypothetical protein